MAVAINRTLDFHILNGATKLKFPSSDFIGYNQYISTHGIRHEEYNSRTIREHKQQFVCKSRRHSYFVPFASANDNITPNGVQQKNMNIGMEEFSQSEITGLVQSIHDAARYVELAICKYSSSSKTSWFSKSWLGVDKDAWIRTLSYQVSVYALLQAAIEISSRGERGDQDTTIFVKRSLLRQCTSLENVVREELSTKQQELYEWYWSHQHNMVLKMYIDLLEKDPKFSPATMLYWKGESSVIDSDASLVLLALSCLAAIKHLGSAKVSCSLFFSMLPDTIGRLMDLLVDFVAIQKTYNSMRNIGLRKEFLFHFGPRAASIRYNNDNGTEEIVFWINLVQNQLKMAIDREKIWSRLTTSESIEVLEKDLAIFGFFIALGKSTKSFLSTNGVPLMNDQIESIIRFLIGGSVLYYPQLSSISSYQMYVEVVCEELEWLPFYPSDVPKDSKPKVKRGISNKEALSIVLDVCAYWMTSFIKYSTWLENPSNIKATRFLSKGHSKLIECMKDVGISEMNAVEDAGSRGSEMDMPFENELDYFDKALESVEEALNKLEILLQELHLSNSNTNTDDLKAACSDLERLRKLKKEAEFLEASLRAKAALLGQGNLVEVPPSSTNKWIWFSNKKAKESESAKRTVERSGKEPFWRYLVPDSSRKNGSELSAVGQNVKSSSTDNQESELDEIRRFELLRRELIEVGKRVQKSTDAKNEEELEFGNGIIASTINNEQKKDDVIAKSIEKIKETSTDVLQGTQLLAIDVAAAMGLLRRAVTGDELAEKEKKALQRTLTDLASVVPIGVLMLLPVTAVGHAAILAAIQRYAPSLIPSTYGPERLDLLRQLEKVKETEIVETSSDENEMTEVINSTSNNNPQ